MSITVKFHSPHARKRGGLLAKLEVGAVVQLLLCIAYVLIALLLLVTEQMRACTAPKVVNKGRKETPWNIHQTVLFDPLLCLSTKALNRD